MLTFEGANRRTTPFSHPSSRSSKGGPRTPSPVASERCVVIAHSLPSCGRFPLPPSFSTAPWNTPESFGTTSHRSPRVGLREGQAAQPGRVLGPRADISSRSGTMRSGSRTGDRAAERPVPRRAPRTCAADDSLARDRSTSSLRDGCTRFRSSCCPSVAGLRRSPKLTRGVLTETDHPRADTN